MTAPRFDHDRRRLPTAASVDEVVGAGADETEKFDSDLDTGAILLVIDAPDLRADYKGKGRTP